jgi:serine/threonine protein kinase
MTFARGVMIRDRWRVLRLLGDGGTSEVYLVEDVRSPDRLFALKILKPAMRAQMAERFRAEGSKPLSHPGIVQVYESFEHRGLLCLRLAYIEGESLAHRIAKAGALSEAEALPLMEGVLEALNFAHVSGVIHRDVKPSNILLDRIGTPHLCDFGIARQLGPTRLTRVGTPMGTPQYMSPEQIITPLDCDHRTDLYSAGIVLYEMLTGQPPFGNERTTSDYVIMDKQVTAEPPDPRTLNPRVSAPLLEILDTALQKKPGLRFQGGMEFAQALRDYRLGPAPPKPGTVVPQPPVPATSRPLYAIYQHPMSRLTLRAQCGFSWTAALQGPFWLARHQLVGKASLFFVLSMLMLVYVPSVPLLFVPATCICWGLIPACLGNRWRMRKLEQQGYILQGYDPPQR